MRFRRGLVSLLVVALTSANVAQAEPPSDVAVAMRRGLIEQAQEARAAGDHARAVDLARRALEVSASTSLRRFIAEEEEALGRWAEALGAAELCAHDGAKTPGQSVHVEACRAIAERAKSSVGHLVLRVEPSDARVVVGGVEVPALVWGAPYVVSPGAVSVEATAEGHAPYRTTVSVTRGESVNVTIALTAVPPTSDGSVPAAPPAPRVATPTPALSPAPETRPLPLLVPIGAGVAAVGAAVAIGVGLLANGRLSDYESRCAVAGAPSGCGAEQVALQDELDTKAFVVNAALAVAAVGAVTSVIGFFVGGRSSATQRSTARPGVLF